MGSAEGAAKSRAAFLAKWRAGEIRTVRRVGASGLAQAFVPVQRVFVPKVQLLGRAIMALMLGPLPAPELAKRCGVEVEDLADCVEMLRPHVQAIRLGEVHLVFGLWESWAAIHEARERLLVVEEVCRVAA